MHRAASGVHCSKRRQGVVSPSSSDRYGWGRGRIAARAAHHGDQLRQHCRPGRRRRDGRRPGPRTTTATTTRVHDEGDSLAPRTHCLRRRSRLHTAARRRSGGLDLCAHAAEIGAEIKDPEAIAGTSPRRTHYTNPFHLSIGNREIKDGR